MDKYLHYKALDLAQEPSFIQWVKGKESKNSEDWSNWLTQHPNMAGVVEEARRIVNSVVFKQEEIDSKIKDRLWNNINDQTNTNAQPKTSIIRLLAYGAAAAVAVFLVFTTVMSPYDTTVETSYAKTEFVDLPDGSSVAINADSKLSYDAGSWDKDRTLTLEGEAYFEVEKGSQFKVKTEAGEVAVLGTSFNVFAREDLLFVQCETGKVRVTNDEAETILIANETVKIEEGRHGAKSSLEAEGRRSQWQSGLFSYKNTTLGTVVNELERQFDVEIKIDQSLLDQEYTGSFKIANGADAMSEVFWPLNLEFKQEGNIVNVTKQ